MKPSVAPLHLLVLCTAVLLTSCSSLTPYKIWEKEEPKPTIVKPKPLKREHTFEDKLILIQTRSILDQLTLMDKFEHDELNLDQINSRRKDLTDKLIQKEELLLTCSRYHKDKNLSISLECARMANKISPTSASKNALKDIQKLVAAKARKKQVTKTAIKKQKRDLLMAQAKQQFSQASYSATTKTLNQLLTISPNDKEAKRLLRKLKPIQEKHVAELISMGDRLYRDEKIEQALAVWKAAKNLAVNDQELSGKIARAEKVLGSFNKIKGLPEQKIQN